MIAPAEQQTPAFTGGSPRRPVVLVVDDERDLRDVVAEVLEDAGYEVAQAADGAQALEVLRAGLRPVLLLVDLRMPVLDGEAFCLRWHADPALCEIPLVLCSAETRVHSLAARLGCTAALEKPFELEALLEQVRQLGSWPGDGDQPSLH